MNTILVISNRSSLKLADKLRVSLLAKGFKVAKNFDESVDLVVTVGGDGTFLKTVRWLGFPPCPFIGVNTGHLGFFQEISTDEIESFLQILVDETYKIHKIYPLKVIINEDEKTPHYFINEVCLKNVHSKTMHAGIYIGSDFIESFSGDGIIVSSSSGSTAYNYSAGGSIIDSTLDLLQVTPISPLNTNAYRCLTSGIILPKESIIKLIPETRNEGVLFGDGFKLPSMKISRVEVGYSRKKIIKLMKFGDYKFWKKVKEKFL